MNIVGKRYREFKEDEVLALNKRESVVFPTRIHQWPLSISAFPIK